MSAALSKVIELLNKCILEKQNSIINLDQPYLSCEIKSSPGCSRERFIENITENTFKIKESLIDI